MTLWAWKGARGTANIWEVQGKAAHSGNAPCNAFKEMAAQWLLCLHSERFSFPPPLISSHLICLAARSRKSFSFSLSLSLLSQLPQLREEENSQAWTPKKVDSGGKRRGREEKVLGYIQGAWSANENMLTLDKWDELTNNGTFFFFTEHSLIVPRKE